MKDHLGNTRATFALAAPGVVQVAEYQHYYPFGMQMEGLCLPAYFDVTNNQLYNGKELQSDYHLQWYDYGARFYDPQLGRWHVPDPAIEDNHYEWTPYAYAANNPIINIDPDGRVVVTVNGAAQQAILNTLTREDMAYVKFNDNGTLDRDLLNSVCL